MEPWKLVASLALTASALAGQGKRAIAVGDTVRDSLTRHDALLPAESTYAQQWRLAGTAGQTLDNHPAAGPLGAGALPPRPPAPPPPRPGHRLGGPAPGPPPRRRAPP